MTKEQKYEIIEFLKYETTKGDLILQDALSLIQEQQEEIEKKDKLEKEVAENINEVAIELSKLTDNIFIINQAMRLQKIAQKKLGKFYID